MIRRRAARWAAILALAGTGFVAGCSGTRDTSGGYRVDLGRAPSAQMLAGVSAEVLQLHGFSLESVQRDLIQTDWRYLPSGVRDRATVRILPRGSDLYVGSLRLTAEATAEGGGWRLTAPSESLRDQYESIQKDVRVRLERVMTQN